MYVENEAELSIGLFAYTLPWVKWVDFTAEIFSDFVVKAEVKIDSETHKICHLIAAVTPVWRH